jgi:hypothetical protein
MEVQLGTVQTHDLHHRDVLRLHGHWKTTNQLLDFKKIDQTKYVKWAHRLSPPN